ncbi:Transposase IS3/IS911 family [Methylobacterium oryzae CBMB20]|uniref:Transposase IS3/IS911 family n=1 Tax=Methylobacterium oryzae CBMB20 TaxID=693986 RepID=A0A089P0I4_9HYPH|nr:Transposase IS3/IS911 family [Methylobacterium oryzae CBMB20]
MGERCGCHSIEVEIAGATVRIAQDASTAQITAVIRALKASS